MTLFTFFFDIRTDVEGNSDRAQWIIKNNWKQKKKSRKIIGYLANNDEEANQTPGFKEYYADISLDDKDPADYQSANSLINDGTGGSESEAGQEAGQEAGDSGKEMAKQAAKDKGAKNLFDKIKGYLNPDQLTSLSSVFYIPKIYPAKESEIPPGLKGVLYSKKQANANKDLQATEYHPETDADGLKGADTSKATKAMGDYTVLTRKLEKGLLGIRDTLYINEYMMGLCKTVASQQKYSAIHKGANDGSDVGATQNSKFVEKNNIVADKDLHGQPLIESMAETEVKPATGLEYEVEYILKGKETDSENKKGVEALLLLVRVPMNLIYLYSHSPERELALSMATAITFGVFAFLVPVVKFLILMIWAFAEAMLDIRLLQAGAKVPFIKTADTFLLTFNVAKGKALAGQIAGEVANNAIGGITTMIAAKAKKTVKDIGKEAKKKMSEVIASCEESSKAYVKQRMEQVVDEGQAYASARIDELNNAMNDYIRSFLKQSRQKLKDGESGQLTVEERQQLSGYATLQALMPAVMPKLDQLLASAVGGDYRLITEKYIMGVTADISTVLEAKIDSVVKKIEQEATDYVNQTVDAIGREVSQAGDQAVDHLAGQLDQLIDQQAAKWSTTAKQFIKRQGGDLTPAATTKTSFITALSFRYEDYLRLFLLMTDETTRLARMGDIIQLQYYAAHSQAIFRLQDQAVAYQAEAECQIQSLFIPYVWQRLSKGQPKQGNITFKATTLRGY